MSFVLNIMNKQYESVEAHGGKSGGGGANVSLRVDMPGDARGMLPAEMIDNPAVPEGHLVDISVVHC